MAHKKVNTENKQESAPATAIEKIDVLLARIPRTDVQFSIAQRYGSESLKDLMLEIYEIVLEVRAILAAESPAVVPTEGPSQSGVGS